MPVGGFISATSMPSKNTPDFSHGKMLRKIFLSAQCCAPAKNGAGCAAQNSAVLLLLLKQFALQLLILTQCKHHATRKEKIEFYTQIKPVALCKSTAARMIS
jgi:hypothetical protein